MAILFLCTINSIHLKLVPFIKPGQNFMYDESLLFEMPLQVALANCRSSRLTSRQQN